MKAIHFLTNLRDGSKLIELYHKGESILLAGPHTYQRDYSESKAEAEKVWKLLDEELKKIVECNGLDPLRKWVLRFSFGRELQLEADAR